MGRVLIVLVTLCAGAPVFAQQQPTASEMAFIYELNRARSDPQRYDTENSLGGILNGVAAQPPLALNLNLIESARFHSDEMATNAYFGHQSAVTGDWPNKMARDAGYPLNSGLSNTTNNIESIAARYTNGTASYSATEALKALIIDQGVPSLGHRKHLLAMEAFYQNFTEVGTGYATGSAASGSGYSNGAYWSIHTGYRDTAMTWLTGVVYNDGNGNGRYDQGEGLSGVTVSVAGGGSMVTTTGGGWSISVTGGSHTVTCSGGAFSGTAMASVTVASDNIEVDFTSGDPDGDVGFSGSSTGGGGGSSGAGDDSDSGGGGCAAGSSSGAPWWSLGLMAALCVLVAGWRLALPLHTK